MAKTEKFDEDSGFIARHFKEDAYRPVYSFGISRFFFRNRRRRVSRWVAASVAAIALTATAVVVSYQLRTDNNAIEPAVVSLPVRQKLTDPMKSYVLNSMTLRCRKLLTE